MKSDVGKRSKSVGIALTPLDVTAFRDGRPFNAGQMAQSGLPLPQSLAGAMRTALMEKYNCNFSLFAKTIQAGASYEKALEDAGAPGWISCVAFRGPWLTRRTSQGLLDIHLPAPANLYCEKADDSKLHVLIPLKETEKVPGWKPLADEPRMQPLWPKTGARLERCKGWISLDGLRQFLSGEPVSRRFLVGEAETNSLFAFDRRTGIGIDPDALSTETGLIYAIGFLSLAPDVFFYGEVHLPDEAPSDSFESIETVAFGGEGRRSRLEILSPVSWPESKKSRPGQGSFLLLNSPGFWTSGWKPGSLSGCLAGAAVPGHIAISGWDLARGGPKPTRFGVPVGSIYFICDDKPDLPTELAEDNEDRLLGYGTYLKGVWNNG
jgi:CRISPR-associated protein Cmr3